MNENCPCKKKKCTRHGDCDECRKHHAGLKGERPVACERISNAEKERKKEKADGNAE